MNLRISKREFQSQVHVFRITAVIILLTVIYYHSVLDQFIEYTWKHYLYPSPIFRHDTFEPMLASTWFLIIISCWYEVDMRLKFLDKYRIHISTSGEDNGKKTWKGRESAIWNEGAWYLIPLIIFDYFFPRRTLAVEAPTFYQMT